MRKKRSLCLSRISIFWSAFKYLKTCLHNILLHCNKFSVIFLVLHSSCNKYHFKWTIIYCHYILHNHKTISTDLKWQRWPELKTPVLWLKPTGANNSSIFLEELINTRTTTIIMVKSVSKLSVVMHIFLSLSLMNSGWLMISFSYIIKNLSFNVPFH